VAGALTPIARIQRPDRLVARRRWFTDRLTNTQNRLPERVENDGFAVL
jgi:hypothetical protein